MTPLSDAKTPSFPGRSPNNGSRTGSAPDGSARRRSERVSRAADLKRLTPREHQVLVHLSKGLRYKEIVDRLGISQGTLHFFIRNLYAKLRVHSRAEAVMKLAKR